MQLNEIKALVTRDTNLDMEVHGIDPSIYLIFYRRDGERTPIKDRDGKNLTFRSRSKAFDALRDAGVQRADFVHRSAFDEMVGVGDGTPTEHREQINLSSTTA